MTTPLPPLPPVAPVEAPAPGRPLLRPDLSGPKPASDLGRRAVLPPGRPPLRLLPTFWRAFRWVALVEAVLYLALALILDATLLDGTRFWGVEPHPFWLIVLLSCLRYGTTEGLAVILMCTLALLVGNLPDVTINQDIFDYSLSVSKQPMLWLIIGVLVGELRNRQIRERDQLRSDLAMSDRQNETLTASYEKLSRLNEDLESRAAGQLRTVISIYQAARKMERLGAAEVLEGVADMVRSLMHPQKFSVFLLEEGGGLRAVITDGWAEDDHFPRVYGTESLLYEAVIGQRRILSAAEPGDSLALRHDGLIAGPMHSATTGEVLGMLKVEALPFADFNAGALENFRTVCEWVGTAYANARLYETAKTESMIDPEIGLMTDRFFHRQTEFVTALARRMNFDVALLTVKALTDQTRSAEEARTIAKALAASVQGMLRTTDMAFDRHASEGGFSILLPNTPASGAQIALDKLRSDFIGRLQALEPPPQIDTAILMLCQYDPTRRTYAELMQEQAQAQGQGQAQTPPSGAA